MCTHAHASRDRIGTKMKIIPRIGRAWITARKPLNYFVGSIIILDACVIVIMLVSALLVSRTLNCLTRRINISTVIQVNRIYRIYVLELLDK